MSMCFGLVSMKATVFCRNLKTPLLVLLLYNVFLDVKLLSKRINVPLPPTEGKQL